jgi:hypothetical protein
MSSPSALLVTLIAFVLFVAFLADFAVGLWDKFNSAMSNATQNINAVGGNISATYTEPWINPRWGADQMFPVLMFVIWIVLLAVVALVAEALRERREGGGDDE